MADKVYPDDLTDAQRTILLKYGFKAENLDDLTKTLSAEDMPKDRKDAVGLAIALGYAYSSRDNSGVGINSLGIAPPLILLSISLPLPGSKGSTESLTLANCPAPPLCFLCI